MGTPTEPDPRSATMGGDPVVAAEQPRTNAPANDKDALWGNVSNAWTGLQGLLGLPEENATLRAQVEELTVRLERAIEALSAFGIDRDIEDPVGAADGLAERLVRNTLDVREENERLRVDLDALIADIDQLKAKHKSELTKQDDYIEDLKKQMLRMRQENITWVKQASQERQDEAARAAKLQTQVDDLKDANQALLQATEGLGNPAATRDTVETDALRAKVAELGRQLAASRLELQATQAATQTADALRQQLDAVNAENRKLKSLTPVPRVGTPSRPSDDATKALRAKLKDADEEIAQLKELVAQREAEALSREAATAATRLSNDSVLETRVSELEATIKRKDLDFLRLTHMYNYAMNDIDHLEHLFTKCAIVLPFEPIRAFRKKLVLDRPVKLEPIQDLSCYSEDQYLRAWGKKLKKPYRPWDTGSRLL